LAKHRRPEPPRQSGDDAEAANAHPFAPRPKPFSDLQDLWRRSGLSRASLERLAGADAFRSLGLDRREALWALRGLPETRALPLFDHADASELGDEPRAALPLMPLSEHVVNDYRTLRLSLKAHPMQFLRPRFAAARIASCADVRGFRDGSRIDIAGLVLVRQRPGSSQGVVFMTIEDETGIANAVIWPRTFEANRQVVMAARLILIHGRVQRHEDIIHIVAAHMEDCSDDLSLLSDDGLEAHHLLANADEVRRPEPGSWRQEKRKDETRLTPSVAHDDHAEHAGEDARQKKHARQDRYSRPHPRWRPRHPRAERILPKSRDFH
jgi:error-prone DNA polymerase